MRDVWMPGEVAAEAELRRAAPPRALHCRRCKYRVSADLRPSNSRVPFTEAERFEMLRRHLWTAHTQYMRGVTASLDAPDKLRTTHEFYERPRKPHAPD